MGRYNLLIKPSAVKEIKGIVQKKDHQRIVQQIESLADNPRPSGCEKLAHQNSYRVREGWYWIIYEVDDQLENILVVKVGQRMVEKRLGPKR